jgi:8-oxo-dGTP pyrophosphatase MutT (NUDIX family)
MEPRNLLSPGRRGLSVEDVRDRLARAASPGRRRAPSGPYDTGIPRGDHDLNPDMYEPGRPLTAAAVLVPIVTHASGLTVLLTRRTAHLETHAGQISFPGGRIEPGDDSPAAAALRETEEEIGLPSRDVRLIGTLDTYVTRTGFEVTPVVGLISPPLSLILDAFEVAEAFEAPLDFFLEPGSLQRHSRHFEGKERHFYVYPFNEHFIWGATAGMLVNLSELLTAPGKGD